MIIALVCLSFVATLALVLAGWYVHRASNELTAARNSLMAVLAAFQPAIDELNATAAALTAAAGTIATAQDVTDSVAAVQTAADAVKAAAAPLLPAA